MACGQQSYPIDVAIAIEHMALAAWELGIGTCWIGAFSEDEVKKALGVPKEIRVVELLPLGYPKEVPAARARKSLDEIVHREKWGGGAKG
jgi:nitroreductase